MSAGTKEKRRSPRRSKAYRMAAIPLYVALFLIIALSIAWFNRGALAEQAVRYALGRAGFEVTSLEVARIDQKEVHLSELRALLKTDETQYINIKSLKLAYHLGVGRQFFVQTIDITGIQTRFALDTLMSFTKGRADDDAQPTPLADLFDIARIKEGNFALITPYGILEAVFDGYFDTSEGGEFNLAARGQEISGEDGTAEIETFFVTVRFPSDDKAALSAGMAGKATGRLGDVQDFEWLAMLEGPPYTALLNDETATLKGHVNVLLKGLEVSKVKEFITANGLPSYASAYTPVLEAIADGVDITGRSAVSLGQKGMVRVGQKGDALEARFGETGFINIEPLNGAFIDTSQPQWPIGALINTGGKAGGGTVPQAAGELKMQTGKDGVKVSSLIKVRDIFFAGIKVVEPAQVEIDARFLDGTLEGEFDIDSPFNYEQGAVSTQGRAKLLGEVSGSEEALDITMAIGTSDACIDIKSIKYNGGVSAKNNGAKLCQIGPPLKVARRDTLKIEGGYEGKGVDFTLASGEYKGRVLAPLSRLNIFMEDGKGGVSYELSDVDISVQDLINISDISLSGEALFGEEVPQITTQISDVILSDPRQDRIFAPIKLIPDVKIDATKLTVSGQFFSLGDVKLGEGSIWLDFDGLSGEGVVDLVDMAFYDGGVQPQRLILPMRSVMSDVVGAANGRVVFKIEEGALAQSRAEFNLVDLAFSGPTGPVAGVNTSLKLSNLVPPATDGPQVMKIGVMNLGVNFLDGVVEYELLPSGDIEIAKAEWPFAGGIMGLYGTHVPKGLKNFDTTVEIKDLDISELFNIADITGFDGTGKLNGSLPLRLEDQRGPVITGRLETNGAGRLEYIRPQSARTQGVKASASTEVPGGADLLFQALENFEYDKLVLDLDGPILGEMGIKMKVFGRNPDVLNGKAIELNVATQAILPDLIASAQYQTYLTRAAKIPGADILTD